MATGRDVENVTIDQVIAVYMKDIADLKDLDCLGRLRVAMNAFLTTMGLQDTSADKKKVYIRTVSTYKTENLDKECVVATDFVEGTSRTTISRVYAKIRVSNVKPKNETASGSGFARRGKYASPNSKTERTPKKTQTESTPLVFTTWSVYCKDLKESPVDTLRPMIRDLFKQFKKSLETPIFGYIILDD